MLHRSVSEPPKACRAIEPTRHRQKLEMRRLRVCSDVGIFSANPVRRSLLHRWEGKRPAWRAICSAVGSEKAILYLIGDYSEAPAARAFGSETPPFAGCSPVKSPRPG